MDKDKLNPPPYRDFIGDMLKSNTENEEMANLEGVGKPLSKEYLSGDTFQHFQRIAKDAGYKPHWLKLQHEIRDEIIEIAKLKLANRATNLEQQVMEVNRKISEYDKSCPPPLQKGRISYQNIEVAIERWK